MKIMKKILIVLLFTLSVVSCSDFLDVNTDPNNPTEVNPELVLPVAQVYTANSTQDWVGTRMYNTFGSMMMYNWSQSDGFSWYWDEFQYLVTPNFYDQLWDNTYTNTLKQYNVLDLYEGEDYNNYKAISKIMKSYHFQMLVDTYGDIPYTEALQRGAIPLPKYDNAEFVYDDLIAELSNAIVLIEAAEANPSSMVPGTDDAMFHGDMTAWKQLANTIKMRILVRQSGMGSKQGFIQAEFAKIMNEGSGFLTADASVNPGYFQEERKQNPLWESYGQTAAGDGAMNGNATCATDYILSYLDAKSDPRIDYLYEEPATGHLGVPQGLENYPPDGSLEPEFVSNVGPGLLKGADQDAPFFSLAESLFLQAEAATHGYISGSAQGFYESGITAAFAYLGAPGAAAYYGNGMDLVDWSASPNKMEAIITQKWLALNGVNAFESWVEYNRTGYPSNLPISTYASQADRPVRLEYPASEISSNGGNVPNQPDAFSDKIFWAN